MERISKQFIIAAAFGSISLAPAAFAQTPPGGTTVLPQVKVGDVGPPSIRVSYVDLDLASDAGMRTLNTRIRKAVHSVCWRSFDPRELEDVYQCRNQSRSDAWRQFERNQERAQPEQDLMVAAIATGPDSH